MSVETNGTRSIDAVIDAPASLTRSSVRRTSPHTARSPCPDTEARSASGGATRVQILHGDQDEIVPYSHGVQLASLIREAGDSATAEMVTVPKAGHNDLWAPGYETSVLEAIRDFVERP